MSIKSVKWVACGDDRHWCNLKHLTLDFEATGVYFIWKPGNPAKAIRCGQGDIADRLRAHRTDPNITRHGDDLLVTWAVLGRRDLDGVELFLSRQYDYAEGVRYPDALPIAVNLP